MESIRVRKSRRKLDGGLPSLHLRLVFRLSAMFGLSPLVFEYGKSRFSYTRGLYSIFISCVILWFGYLNFYFVLNLFNDNSLTIIALINIPVYLSLPISSVLDAFSIASEYGYIFQELKMIDGELSAIGVLKVLRPDWSARLFQISSLSAHYILVIIMRPDLSAMFHFIGIASYTLMCSQIIAIGCHILSRYDLVVNTLSQLKSTQHSINNKVETLLAVNHQLSKVSQQFDFLLYQLMISDEDFGLLDNPKLKLHIAMKNNVSITACEFFTLDFSLVLAVRNL
ncbi:unnamed protein product, partial [Nezara viridula]